MFDICYPGMKLYHAIILFIFVSYTKSYKMPQISNNKKKSGCLYQELRFILKDILLHTIRSESKLCFIKNTKNRDHI